MVRTGSRRYWVAVNILFLGLSVVCIGVYFLLFETANLTFLALFGIKVTINDH